MLKEKRKTPTKKTKVAKKSSHQKSIKMVKNAAAEYKTENSSTDKFINKIICGDTIEIMKSIPSESIDLIVTSPPYNLKNSTGNGMKDGRGGKWKNAALVKGYSHYNDNMPHDKYVEWQRNCLTEMMRLIKNDGAIFYNHKWRVQDGLLQDRQDCARAATSERIFS